jgi:fructose-1-phosphate kinase PfkB-like protein
VTVATGGAVRAVTAGGEWTARIAGADHADRKVARGALVAGLVPGQLLGWSWPDRLRHALALAAADGAVADSAGGDAAAEDGGYRVDLAAYERLLDAVTVEGRVGLSCSA